MYPKAEIIFPAPLIYTLRDLRETEWRELVDRVAKLEETHPDNLAFCLLMIRLDGCLKCYSGSYKFMRGCELCAAQSVMQFKGDEHELIELYEECRRQIIDYLENDGPPPDGEPL